ncbi:MAG TPA: protein kinase [Polyangiaceae bacterium]|jgi:serine/threonine-protein kinase|nr:protein kinase [Polyangiaceae bacterium]
MGESAPGSRLDGTEPRAFGRYVLYAPIARGGMATIHIARLVGDDGFNRIVAAKRLHPQFTEDPDFVAMFRDEAEIASKIHHPNVVPVLDIVLDGEEVVLVQEYVHGVPLDRLFRAACAGNEPIPVRIVVGILSGILSGLHAAHETTDERGEPLGIIHRDVSPQNVMVSVDGIPRLLDFGIAKASSSAHVTRAGFLKGKLAYMAPEQVRGEEATRAADVYACGVVLWELLALRRLHAGRSETQILTAVLHDQAPAVTTALEPLRGAMPKERWDAVKRLEAVVSKAICPAAGDRYQSAADMLMAVLRAAPAASALEVAAWVKARGAEYLERRQQVLASNEESWRSLSKVAVAAIAAGGPTSGVTRVRESSRVVSPPTPTSFAQSASAMFVGAPVSEPSRRVRAVPWALAAAATVVSAILLFLMQARGPVPPEAVVPATSLAPPTEVTASPGSSPAVVPAPSDPSPPTSFLSAPSMPGGAPSASPTHAAMRLVSAPASRRIAVESVPSRSSPPQPPPMASPPAGPRPECDPPFYFEGTKKVFKPSCI